MDSTSRPQRRKTLSRTKKAQHACAVNQKRDTNGNDALFKRTWLSPNVSLKEVIKQTMTRERYLKAIACADGKKYTTPEKTPMRKYTEEVEAIIKKVSAYIDFALAENIRRPKEERLSIFFIDYALISHDVFLVMESAKKVNNIFNKWEVYEYVKENIRSIWCIENDISVRETYSPQHGLSLIFPTEAKKDVASV